MIESESFPRLKEAVCHKFWRAASHWRRYPSLPRNRWLDQLRRVIRTPLADLWRRAVTRGHSGVTLQSFSTTTRRTR